MFLCYDGFHLQFRYESAVSQLIMRVDTSYLHTHWKLALQPYYYKTTQQL